MARSRKCPECGASVAAGAAFCGKCGSKQRQSMNEEELNRDPFEILQVSRDAEPEVVDAAYRSLARKYHPDSGESGGDSEKMKEINWAYGVLKDATKRREWESRGKNGHRSQARSASPDRPKEGDRNEQSTAWQSGANGQSSAPGTTSSTYTYRPNPSDVPSSTGKGARRIIGGLLVGALLLWGLQAILGQGSGGSKPTSAMAPTSILPTRPPATATRRTPTRTPSPTREPNEPAVSMEDLQQKLRANGYKRFPFVDSGGNSAFSWVNGNGWERVVTWDYGALRLEVLDDKSAATRLNHMQPKLQVLDSLFTPAFMAELRRQNNSYNQKVTSSVSGPPDQLWPSNANDPWKFKIGQYNTQDMSIRGIRVEFSLWWWQVTCPSQYQYCFMTDFPGTNFTGDASIVSYTIYIELAPNAGGTATNSS